MISTAKINQNSQTAKVGDIIQWHDARGRLQVGRISRIARSAGNTLLRLDGGRNVPAWYAQLATLIRITPHSAHQLRADLVADDRVIPAGTTVLITTWYAGKVAFVVDNQLPGMTTTMAAVTAALVPGQDPQLVTWSLGG